MSKRSSGPTHRHPPSAGVLEEASRGALPAGAQEAAWGFLPLQRPPRGLVPAQLRAALAVPMGRAGLPGVAGPLRGPRAGGHALGDVLVVCGRASLVRAAVMEKQLTLSDLPLHFLLAKSVTFPPAPFG